MKTVIIEQIMLELLQPTPLSWTTILISGRYA